VPQHWSIWAQCCLAAARRAILEASAAIST
jgi:hypothetical protein